MYTLKKLQFFLLVLSFGLVNSACEKEQEPQMDSTYHCYLTSMARNAVVISSYELDDDNRPTHRYFYNFVTGQLNSYHEMIYDNDQLIRTNNYSNSDSLEGYYVYEYFDEDSIRRYDYTTNGNSETFKQYSVFKFDSSSTCTYLGRFTYDALGDTLKFRTTTQYIDEACSVVFTNYDARTRIETTTIAKNELKNGPFKMVAASPYLEINKNLVASKQEFDGQGSLLNSKSYTSTFDYNEYDYPIKETRTYDSGEIETYTYQYVCKD